MDVNQQNTNQQNTNQQNKNFTDLFPGVENNNKSVTDGINTPLGNEISALMVEIKKLGDEITKKREQNATNNNDNQNQNQQVQMTEDEQSQEQEPPSSNQRGSSTPNSGNYNDERDYFEIERRIVDDVTRIKANADSYGEVVDVVGRRAVLARRENGRGSGYEYEYKLSDGRIVSNDYAWELANAGKLRNIIGSHNKGRKYIRAVGDGVSKNNLGALPRF